jgi:hypothetical protein
MRQQDTWNLAGPGGSAKTWMMLSLAVVAAPGRRWLRWRCPIQRRVLPVDGGMPGRALQAERAMEAGDEAALEALRRTP